MALECEACDAFIDQHAHGRQAAGLGTHRHLFPGRDGARGGDGARQVLRGGGGHGHGLAAAAGGQHQTASMALTVDGNPALAIGGDGLRVQLV